MNKFLFLGTFYILSLQAMAQNVGIGTIAPNASAKLEVNANNKGMLIPRMTTSQRNAINSPALGLLVFDTDKATIMFFDGAKWRAMAFTDEDKVAAQSRSANDPVQSAAFGSRVSISGNYAVIGAPHLTVNGKLNVGAIYIFSKASGAWKQEAKLLAKDGEQSDYFGGSVCISGNFVIAGAANKKVGDNTAQGKVYVFTKSGSSWIQDTVLTKTSGLAYEDFGWSVGICSLTTGGPTAMVGIPYSDAAGTDKGEVYCYKRNNTTKKWAYIQNIIPGDLGASDYFGETISMDSDYAVIGAPSQDNVTYTLADAGAAYIYVFGGGVYNFQQKLSGITKSAEFGFSASISGDRIAIGAPWATTYSNSSPSVFLYKRTGATWANITYFFLYDFEVVPGAVSGTNIAYTTFGLSVSLDGNNLMVGASGGIESPNGGSRYYSSWAGTVFFYKNFSGNTFTKTQTIKSEYSSTGDLFGMSLGISDGKYIISNARAFEGNLPNAGKVYFGDLNDN